MDRLVSLLCDDLQRRARQPAARGMGDPAPSSISLVREAYRELVDETHIGARSQVLFFGAAAKAMRRVLVDQAGRQEAQERDVGVHSKTVAERDLHAAELREDLLDLDEALEQLAHHHARVVRVFECRFFAGLSVAETADVLEADPPSVEKDEALARAWIYRERRVPRRSTFQVPAHILHQRP